MACTDPDAPHCPACDGCLRELLDARTADHDAVVAERDALAASQRREAAATAAELRDLVDRLYREEVRTVHACARLLERRAAELDPAGEDVER